ncbi:hypothetical protein ACFXJ8_24550 [Nonomuraea sp. NPDC059194]|uniref:hypothetical protein n=1 Tax=Nonomuraea sp. NPDC059194 TaxID=3346764 RepID=UPI003691F2FA
MNEKDDSVQALRAAYRAMEAEARDYADPGRAVAVARRRGRARIAVAGVCLAVVAMLAGAGLRLWPGEAPAVIAATPSSPVVITPPATAAPLPEAGTGQPGLMVYTPCMHGCPTYVALADGRQHLLGEKTAPPPGNLTLSPDGRWLGLPVATGYELRDLVSGTVHQIAFPGRSDHGAVLSPWAWSADGRRLILGHHASGDVLAYLEVDVNTGRTSVPAVPRGFEPLGLLVTGELLLFEESRYGKQATRVELAVGGPERTITLDGGATPLVTADGGPSIQVRGDRFYAVAPDLTAVVEFDATGREVRRLPLRSGEGPLGPLQDGFAVQSGPVVEVRTPSGARRLADLPETALVVLPGMARH